MWWCAVGENIDVEINGKSETFARPVVVMRKLSGLCFMGIPLTTKEHSGPWYAHFVFRKIHQYAALAQARVFSVSRLYKRIGVIPNSDLGIIRSGFKKLYL